jgi:hypothetical protein
MISNLSVSTVTRSGRFVINGSNFGPNQGASQVLVDNQPAIATLWSDTSIAAYVPEGANVGSDPVVVQTSGGTSNGATLNVTTRQAEGRIKWRFITNSYAAHRAGVGPDGTVYVNDAIGFVYALAPDGALKWVTRVGDTGSDGPVTVGADGSIYVPTTAPTGVASYHDGAIVALNPDGTQKWKFIAANTITVRAGPNVGPDGKIYFIFRPENGEPGTINLAALAPEDGHLVWNYNDLYYYYGHTGKELFFGAAAGLTYFDFESATFPHGGFYAHRLNDGARVRAIGDFATDGVVVVAPDQTVHTSVPQIRSYSPTLDSVNWTFPIFGQGPTPGRQPINYPEVGADSVHYQVQNYYRLYAINPNGAEKWHYDDSDTVNGFHILHELAASPANQIIFVPGIIGYGKPGFFLGLDPQTGARLWRVPLPTEPGFAEYGQVRPWNRPIFSPDGQTGYISADVAGNYSYDYFYAVDTSNTTPCSSSLSPQGRTIPYNGGAFTVDVTSTYENCGWTAASNASWMTIDSGASEAGNGIVKFTAAANTTTGERTGTLTIAGNTFTVTQPGVPPGSPTINITYPANTATFTLPTSIFVAADAAASDGRNLTRVDFYYDGSNLIGSDASAPYQVAWDNPAGGSRVLTAVAVDNLGATTISAPVNLQINSGNLLPLPIGKPTLDSPTQGQSFTEPAIIELSATRAAGNYTVSRMEFYAGTTLLGFDSDAPYTFSWKNVPAGRYTISARTVSTNGARATSTLADITVNPREGINGVITGNGLPLSGVTVALTGTQSGSTSTDINGHYSFPDLQAGGAYSVTPADTALYSFTEQTIKKLQGVTAVDFSGTVRTYNISGHVIYTASDAGVGDAQVTLSGASGFPTQTATTLADGSYTFSNVPAGGNYTIAPSKASSEAGGVSAFDASLTARYALNLISLNSEQQIAADASNNNGVSAFDASLIARSALSIPNESIVGSWKFKQASRTVTNLDGDQTGQDFAAVLVGDVSASWTPPAPAFAFKSFSTLAVSIPVSLPNRSDPAGGPSIILVNTGDLTNQNVFAYEFDFTFDPNVLQPQSTAYDATSTLSEGMSINANTATPGHMKINAFSSNNPLSGQGVLLKLAFNVVGSQGAQTPLTWQSFRFNEGNPSSGTSNGQFSVAGPTAADATISGSITTADGQPLGGVVLTLDGTRASRTITDSKGNYIFENLGTAGLYTVVPSRANYSFSPQIRSFSLTGNNTQAVFTAAPDSAQTANPLDTPMYFVRQQYLDFLHREPDAGGLNYWTAEIEKCGADGACVNSRRIGVSAAFFVEAEFQQTGSFIFRLYQAGLGRQLTYREFSTDQTHLVGGNNLDVARRTFADAFVQRPEFVQRYSSGTSAASFVETLMQTIQQTSGIDLSSRRSALISTYNSGASLNESRSLTIREAIEDASFKQAEYNKSFVLMEYFGYLRRDQDQDGYDFWLDVLNNREPGNLRGMACSFLTSSEYQQRFSYIVTHHNAECGR